MQKFVIFLVSIVFICYAAVAAPIFKSEPISDEIKAIITGKSYKANTPFDYSELRYLTLSYIDFEGKSRVGNMIVSAKVSEDVLDIFRELYEAKYPIEKIELVDYYNADDNLSMDNNNTSSFNFRFTPNTTVLSKHSTGMAIDIN
ncbi:MAG: M15 family metallopeptidase, partial [Deferribacteraceae bacterium]|nr:M15 family metallopeptidase [Deferribacteraceae bacterium]